MRRRSLGRLLLLGAALLLSLLVYAATPERRAEVVDRDTGESYYSAGVEDGDAVRLEWTHTIEKTPWVEEYEVSGGKFDLREAKVKSFGAGVDQIASEVENENGWVILRGTGRSFEELRFINSRRAERTLRVAGENVDLERMPRYAAVGVSVENRPRLLWWM